MIGKIISHYKIIGKLGEGGMGEVYLAEDTDLHRNVAIKFLPDYLTNDKENIERFKREAQAAASLNHNNIITIHEIAQEAGQIFIVMEYVDGQSLRDIISDEKSLPQEKVVEVISQISDGLLKAHQAGIVHRDIKPENIIIDNDGRVKILDFGLAKLKGVSKLTKEISTLGTIHYMSPEQIQGKDVDHRSDIWSLGVLLHEMLTGEVPFQGEYEQAVTYAILNGEPEPVQKSHPGVSSEFMHVLNCTLAKNPENRFKSIQDLLEDLRQVKYESDTISRDKTPGEIDISTENVSSTGSVQLTHKRKIYLTSIAAIVGISIIILMIFYFPWNNTPTLVSSAEHSRLTFSGEAFDPEISPDGELFAYISSEDPDMEKLMVQDLRGGAPLTIFEFTTIRSFRWSPDGLTLLVNVRDDSTSYSYIIPRLGGESRVVHDVLPTSSFTWSSDGRQFVISGGIFNRIWFYDWQSGDTASIALHGEFSEINDIHCASSGELLLFKTKSQNLYKIWTINTDGSQQKNVLLDSTKIKSPRWSPEGRAMYYLRENYQTNDLMKLNINPSTGDAEGEPVRLIAALQGEEPISISKDNRKLLFWGKNEISNLKLNKKKNRIFLKKCLLQEQHRCFGRGFLPMVKGSLLVWVGINKNPISMLFRLMVVSRNNSHFLTRLILFLHGHQMEKKSHLYQTRVENTEYGR